MSGPIHILASAAFNPAYRCGGWSGVLKIDKGLTGFAGGERATTLRRMDMAGLGAMLRDLPPTRPLAIQTTSQGLASLIEKRGNPRDTAEAEPDADLWSAVLKGLGDRLVRVSMIPTTPRTSGAFVAAWADFATAKAKDKGPFVAAIPRPNLAKLLELGWP